MVHFRLGAVRANTLQSRRTASLLLVGLTAWTIGATGHYLNPNVSAPALSFIQAAKPMVDDFVDSAPVQAVADAAGEVAAGMQEMAAAVAPKPESFTRIAELGEGRTFSRMLVDAGIPAEMATSASDAMESVYDHRKLKAGEEFTLGITRLGDEETLNSVTFQPEVTKELTITRLADGSYKAQLKNTPLERQRVAARGEVRGSLYAAGEREGVPRNIMAALIRAYAHEVDFQRDIKQGDGFEVLYDQPTAKDGTPVGQGVIIYAALVLNGKTKPLYRVTFGDGAVDYFDDRGQSVKRSLLRTPVEGARMTSGFGMRRHPILGFSKMHKGTDFGAPIGTPIYAAGSGVVEEAQFSGSYGKFVLIRHNGRVETAYAHMSRIAVEDGARVKQGDVIGYVGMTGRSTGPHLHYEVRVDRQPVNPLSMSMPVGRILEGKVLAQFKSGQDKIQKEFSTLLSKAAAGQDRADASAPAAKVAYKQ